MEHLASSLKATTLGGAALLLTACGGGSGEGLDASGRPPGEAGARIELAATYDALQANLFTPSCAVSGCHSGAGAPLGLDLSAGVAYANLVGAAGQTRVAGRTLLRVNPGNAADSLLVRKLRGDPDAGERMPLDRTPIAPSTIALVEDWINAGAPRSGTGAAAAAPPPRVVATLPAADALVSSFPAALEITFNQPMDAATLAGLTVEVSRSGGDGVFDDADAVAITPSDITLDSGDLITARVDLSGFTAVTDSYRLRLSGSGPAVVRNTQAVVLDGDADGNAGGDFELRFDFDPDAILPTFESLQTRLFQPTCATAGCHSLATTTCSAGGSAPCGGMNLDAPLTYDSLVNAGSPRIVPGNADSSLVIRYLISGFMPFTVPPGFDDGPSPTPRERFIDALTEWVNNGAPQ